MPSASGSGKFLAGAASTDITPVPGYPLAGHSIAAKVSRGTWLRLHARALFFEDNDGRRLVLLAGDLLGLPAGLADRAAQIVATGPADCRIRSDAIVFAATHTHQGPGALFSTPLYNALAAPKPGFDDALFDYIADGIARAIIAACESRQEARMFLSTIRLRNFTKNRSFLPFLHDDEAANLVAQNADLPLGMPTEHYPYRDVYRAVDPTLHVLRIESTLTPTTTIAMAAFVAVHPTAMSHDTAVYSSDLFGVAATISEQALMRDQHRPAVVAIFNGPEGDVSPDWTTQDRRDAMRLGEALAAEILAARQGGNRVDGAINFRRSNVFFGGRCATPPFEARCTGPHIEAGLPLLGGAEDGRTVSFYEGCVEGIRRHDPDPGDDPQYPKFTDVTPSCRIPFVLPIHSTTTVSALFPGPTILPFGVYMLGGVAFAAVPGEFTTVLGMRLRKAVETNLAPRPDAVIVVGLANEYVSYFATPEEYDEQHYEGASTLYGRWSGVVVASELTSLARQLGGGPPPPSTDRAYAYSPGFVSHFGELKAVADLHDPLSKDLENILLDPITGLPLESKAPKFCWTEPASGYRMPSGIPTIAIETDAGGGVWQPASVDGVPESDQGTRIVFAIERVEQGTASACGFWMSPATLHGNFRFRVRTAAGDELHSPPFKL